MAKKKRRGQPPPRPGTVPAGETLADLRARQSVYGNAGSPTPYAFVYQCPRCQRTEGHIWKSVKHCTLCDCRMKLTEG